jgi:hypothetical protein
MALKRKNSQAALPQLDFPPPTPQYGDLVQRKDSESSYQTIKNAHDGNTVILTIERY